jgi:Domain of unknown function (DUF5753)/Helix-turn-helix domain
MGGSAARGAGSAGRPTLFDRGLGRELRRLREHAGLDAETAGAAIGVAATVVDEVEAGRIVLAERDLVDLLGSYGLPDEAQHGEHLSLAREAVRAGWWEVHTDLLPSLYIEYLRLERAAAVIRTFGERLVPRLLQTPEYARAVVTGDDDDPGTVARRVELRMLRQAAVFVPGGPTVWAVISEAALRWPVLAPAAQDAQLAHLLEIQQRPGVVLQILPATRTAGLTSGGSFTVLRFTPQFLTDIVYLQQTTGSLRLDRSADVEHYSLLMDRLVSRAEQPRRTASILCALRREA